MPNGDTQDEELDVPPEATPTSLLELCRDHLMGRPPLLRRGFARASPDGKALEGGSNAAIRVMQWNILSQSLGLENDNFVACPEEALQWSTRRFRLLEEMLVHKPDILCLQEVDHFHFLQKTLGRVGYTGTFFPKPDSPCIYLDGNNGPDGCAIFYNRAKFTHVRTETRVLEVWGIQSNQVAILIILRHHDSDEQICVVTTHLKARQGALLATLRNEQGKDLTAFVKQEASGRPLLICGDFNAEPSEPIYRTILDDQKLSLASSYVAVDADHHEPKYTTWKIRGDGESCHTIDYMFHSTAHWDVDAALQFPTKEQIGAGRVPSLQYPSDHFSLVCDYRLKLSDAELDQQKQ